MSDEKKNDDAPQISDEKLEDVSGGATKPMGWDNTKHIKWSESGVDSLASEEDSPTDLTRKG